MSFLLAFIWFKVQGSGLRWLINTKTHLQRCAFCFAFIWFRAQGSRSGFAAFFIGRCSKVVF